MIPFTCRGVRFWASSMMSQVSVMERPRMKFMASAVMMPVSKR